jgi:hypothetical protein
MAVKILCCAKSYAKRSRYRLGSSDKLLIVNHPMTCNRYGFPRHLPPWNTMFGGFEGQLAA